MIRCTFMGVWLTLNERKQEDVSFQCTHIACSMLVTCSIPTKPHRRRFGNKTERSNNINNVKRQTEEKNMYNSRHTDLMSVH